MISKIKKTLNRIYSQLLIYNNPFYFYGIPNCDYLIKGQSVLLKKMDLRLNRKEGESLLKGYPYAIKIIEALNAKFSVQDKSIFLQIQNLKFQINSAEELFIIYEVFVTEVYNFNCLRDTVFIDVGMNSGVTTLFYAKNPLIKKIYSFELFRPTFLLGQRNLKFNKEVVQKIEAYNYGLSNKSFESTLDYSLSRKGRMGLKGLPFDEQFNDVQKENVVVKDISEIFEAIIAASGEMDIAVKMDCEGEEYNLIESLASSKLLGKLTAVMIEWHYHKPVEIIDHLRKLGFYVFSQTLPSLDSGIIYASKGQGHF